MLAPRLVRRTAATIALTVAVLGLLVLLAPNPGAFALVSPAVGHFSLFLVLGAALGAWRAAGARRHVPADLILLLGGLLLLASASEVTQYWVDGRSPQTADWVADALGAATGLTVGAGAALLLTARSRSAG